METVSTAFGKATLTLETGKLAKQANGSILVRYGDTVVLVAATADKGTAHCGALAIATHCAAKR